MNNYKKYKYIYLAYKLEEIIIADLMMEAEFIHNIIHNQIRKVIV